MSTPLFNQLQPEKQARVVAAATAVFAEHGFHGADVGEIAAQAGVAKGSLYNYFRNKEDLFLYVCRHGLDRFRTHVYGDILPEWDVFRQMEHVFQRGAEFTRDHPEYARLYLSISAAGMDRLAEVLSPDIETYFAKRFYQLLQTGMASGLVRADLDPRLMALTINSQFAMLLLGLGSRPFTIRMNEYLGPGQPPKTEGDPLRTQVSRLVAHLRALFQASPGSADPPLTPTNEESNHVRRP